MLHRDYKTSSFDMELDRTLSGPGAAAARRRYQDGASQVWGRIGPQQGTSGGEDR